MPGPLLYFGASIALQFVGSLISRRRLKDIDPVPMKVFGATSAPAQWLLGRTRAPGLRCYYLEDTPDDPSLSSGQMEFRTTPGATADVYRDVHLAIAMGEGSFDGLEAVWFNDRRYDLIQDGVESDGSIRYRAAAQVQPYASRLGDLFLVRACFDATGTQGTALRSVANIPSSAVFLQGISWVHVTLRQPPVSVSVGRGWTELPTISLLVRGAKPGGVWTDSAVTLREWWTTEVEGADPSDIVALSVARFYGDEEVMTQLDGPYWRYAEAPPGPLTASGDWTGSASNPTAARPVLWAVHRIPVTAEQVAIGDDGYTDPRAGAWQEPYPYRVREGDGTIVTLRALDTTPGIETMYQPRALQHSAKRYAANGILRSDMSREDVDGEWDWATQGEVVHQGNTRFLLAGHDRVPAFAWNVDESALEDLSVQRTEDSEYGAVQMALERSEPSDWTPATLPALTDGSDGATADLRASLLVSHPIDGGRLLATYVRRKLRDRRVAIKTLPQLHTVWDLKRGDVVTVTLAQADLVDARCTVENLIIDRDLSVMLEFAVTPVDAYADTIDLPDESDQPPVLLPPLTGEVIPEIEFSRIRVDRYLVNNTGQSRTTPSEDEHYLSFRVDIRQPSPGVEWTVQVSTDPTVTSDLLLDETVDADVRRFWGGLRAADPDRRPRGRREHHHAARRGLRWRHALHQGCDRGCRGPGGCGRARDRAWRDAGERARPCRSPW